MTRQNLAMFVCRGMAIYIFFQSLFLIEVVAAGGRQLFADWGEPRKVTESLPIFLASFVPFAATAAFALLLWFKAGRIARRMMVGMHDGSSEDRIMLDQRRTEAVILFGLGAYAIARSLPQIGLVTSQYVISYVSMDEAIGSFTRINLIPSIVQAGLQTLVGMTLLTAAWYRGRRAIDAAPVLPP